MRVHLVSFVMALAKNNKEAAKSSFIPSRLRQIEREMETEKKTRAGNLTVDVIMGKLKEDKMKLNAALKAHEWDMIEKEINKMMK